MYQQFFLHSDLIHVTWDTRKKAFFFGHSIPVLPKIHKFKKSAWRRSYIWFQVQQQTHWAVFLHSSLAQLGHQSIDQLLLLVPGGVNPKLLTGLLQHRHGQLSQGAVLRAFSQLVFWHLHFGLLLGSASGVSCRFIDGESIRSKEWERRILTCDTNNKNS